MKHQKLANLAQAVRAFLSRVLPIPSELRHDDVVFDPLEIIGKRNLEISQLLEKVEGLRELVADMADSIIRKHGGLYFCGACDHEWHEGTPYGEHVHGAGCVLLRANAELRSAHQESVAVQP